MIKCQIQEWTCGPIVVTGTFSFDPVLITRCPGRPKGVKNTTPSKHASRNAEMIDMYRRPETLKAIGQKYGVSRERVRQILAKNGINPEEGGGNRLRKDRREKGMRKIDIAYAEVRARHEVYLRHLGINDETYQASKSNGWMRKFQYDKKNHRMLGHEWTMTFAEWLGIWHRAGHESPPKSRTFKMERIDDYGPYSAQNVCIMPWGEAMSRAVTRASARKRAVDFGEHVR